MPVSAVVVLLLLAGGAWVIYTQVFAPADEFDATQYESNTGAIAVTRGHFFDEGPGVGASMRDNGAEVRLSGARARLIRREGQPDRVELVYTTSRFLDNADRRAVTARWVAMSDPGEAARAKVTPEQIEKLKAIPYQREMAASDEERGQMLALLQRYHDAPEDQRAAIEPELLQTFRNISATSMRGTVEAQKANADQIREVLSADQIRNLRRRSD